MRFKRSSKKIYWISFLFLLLIEISIALWIHDSFIRPYVGDFLVVILIYCFVMAVSPVSVIQGLMTVLIFSFVVEFFQLINIVKVLQYEPPKVVMIILGSSFSVLDLLAYSLGISFSFLMELIQFYYRKDGKMI